MFLSQYFFSSLPFHPCPTLFTFHLSAAYPIPWQLRVLLKIHCTLLDIQQGQQGDFSAEMHELVLSYPAWGNFSQLRFTCSNNTVQ